VFARGVIPIRGTKAAVQALNGRVQCGGVSVSAGDIVVADEEGIVVIPRARRQQVLVDARTTSAREADESLDARETAHRARIDGILSENGFED
jgi:4-hydroxy-4-methyl-2-oxoglutarate aldolase